MNEQADNPVDETNEEAQEAPEAEEAQEAPEAEEAQETTEEDEGAETEESAESDEEGDATKSDEEHIMCYISKEMVPVSKTVSVPYDGNTAHQVHQRFVKFEFNQEESS